jgi:cupin superfamily acireductone dioxygenase involved in methionine salvage
MKPTIDFQVESDELTIIEGSSSSREQVASPHVHHEHTDAFYVLEGELTFEIGCDRQTKTVGAGGFVAVPPNVAHAFSHDSDRPARWLTIHARDGGFARFMRGRQAGVKVDWDIAAVPSDGGSPASAAVLS